MPIRIIYFQNLLNLPSFSFLCKSYPFERNSIPFPPKGMPFLLPGPFLDSACQWRSVRSSRWPSTCDPLASQTSGQVSCTPSCSFEPSRAIWSDTRSGRSTRRPFAIARVASPFAFWTTTTTKGRRPRFRRRQRPQTRTWAAFCLFHETFAD